MKAGLPLVLIEAMESRSWVWASRGRLLAAVGDGDGPQEWVAPELPLHKDSWYYRASRSVLWYLMSVPLEEIPIWLARDKVQDGFNMTDFADGSFPVSGYGYKYVVKEFLGIRLELSI